MIFKKAQIGTQQPSLFFDQWAEGGELKDDEGNALNLYHGTMSPFNQFRPSNDDNNWYGSDVIYTSSHPDDVANNYATEHGGDLRTRMWNKIDEIKEDPEGFDLPPLPTDEEVEQKAKELLQIESARTLKLYGRMHNPAYTSKKDSPRYKVYAPRDEENDDYSEFELSPEVDALLQDIRDVLYEDEETEYKADKIYDDIVGILENDEFSLYELEKTIRDALTKNYIIGSSGNIIQNLYRKMGHDGIIMDAFEAFGNRMDIAPDTKHYIFFHPHQLKSATGNNGLYDPSSGVLTAKRIFRPVFSRKK